MQEPYSSNAVEYVINPFTFEVAPMGVSDTEQYVSITVVNNLVRCRRWVASTKYDFCVRYKKEFCLECYYNGAIYQYPATCLDLDIFMFGIIDGDLYVITEDCIEKIDEGSVFLSKTICNKPDESDLMYIRPNDFKGNIPVTFDNIKIVDDKAFIDKQEYLYTQLAYQLWVSAREPVIRGIEVDTEYLLTIQEECFSSEFLMIADTNNAEKQKDINWLRDGTCIIGFILEYQGSTYIIDLRFLFKMRLFPNAVIISLVKYSNSDEDSYFRICLGTGMYKDIGIDGITTVSTDTGFKEVSIKTDLTVKQIKRCLLLGGVEELYEKQGWRNKNGI